MFNVDSMSNTGPTIGSDALRKAIERNRRKQQDSRSDEASNTWRPPRASETKFSNSLVKTPTVTQSFYRPDEQTETSERPKARSQSSRKRVALQDEEVGFIADLKNTRNKVSEILSYTGTRESRAKKNTGKNWNIYLVKAAWLFIAFLVFRLLFVNRGVVDYYSRDQLFNSKVSAYKNLLKENALLRKEIFKIKNDISLQKKLVRDHLGFISADEFLVLFQKEEMAPSK